jgi:hypothetical protein
MSLPNNSVLMHELMSLLRSRHACILRRDILVRQANAGVRPEGAMALTGSQASAALRDRQQGACGFDATKRRGEAPRFSVKLLAALDVTGGRGSASREIACRGLGQEERCSERR